MSFWKASLPYLLLIACLSTNNCGGRRAIPHQPVSEPYEAAVVEKIPEPTYYKVSRDVDFTEIDRAIAYLSSDRVLEGRLVLQAALELAFTARGMGEFHNIDNRQLRSANEQLAAFYASLVASRESINSLERKIAADSRLIIELQKQINTLIDIINK